MSPTYFNPRSPHGERRWGRRGGGVSRHFNPRSPHGERRSRLFCRIYTFTISIHAPRTGSDIVRDGLRGSVGAISIHAPRTGSDRMERQRRSLVHNFNPRSPHGERLLPSDRLSSATSISIHAPRTGSDGRSATARISRHISIHAPRTGSDTIKNIDKIEMLISIHAPRTGSDVLRLDVLRLNDISIHAPRTGSDALRAHVRAERKAFQSTLPARGATPSFFCFSC